MMRLPVRLKRVYDAPDAEDGVRVLVDRLWPRGVTKAQLKLDLWARDVAPSTALRQWIHRQPEGFDEFEQRYLAELTESSAALAELKAAIRGRAATLLTAAKEPERSHVSVLRNALAAIR
jgi:uncharacterized protein YeaO (DUF488 family)